MITIRNKEYKRINRTIKNESQLIIETEDKLFAYRFTLKNDYLTKNRELIDEFKIYNNIYAIDENIFVDEMVQEILKKNHLDVVALQEHAIATLC